MLVTFVHLYFVGQL